MIIIKIIILYFIQIRHTDDFPSTCTRLVIIMDVLASNIQRGPPWAMLFGDDLMLCEESRLEVEQQLDSWREVY